MCVLWASSALTSVHKDESYIVQGRAEEQGKSQATLEETLGSASLGVGSLVLPELGDMASFGILLSRFSPTEAEI